MLSLFFACQKVFNTEKLALLDECEHALMHVCLCNAGELVARLERDANACGAAELDEALKAFVAAFAGDAYVVKLARTGTDGLLDWMNSEQNFHL